MYFFLKNSIMGNWEVERGVQGMVLILSFQLQGFVLLYRFTCIFLFHCRLLFPLVSFSSLDVYDKCPTLIDFTKTQNGLHHPKRLLREKSLALGYYAWQTVVPAIDWSYDSKSLTTYHCDVNWLITQKHKSIKVHILIARRKVNDFKF